MAQKQARIFHSLREFEDTAEKATKVALNSTLEHLKRDLKEFIKDSIYNAYNPTWYERTNSLLQDSTLEVYIYKNTSNKVGGGIRFNPSYYNSHSGENFQHSNEIRMLPFGSFLEIMNDSSLINPNNPYHFPVIERGAFYDNFQKYTNEVYDDLFSYYFNLAMGAKPNLRGIIRKSSQGMNLSSSTRHISSIGTHNV